MALANSHSHYGGVAKAFHWMTALLILSAFALGLVAMNLPFDTNEQLSLKANVFSAHKTVGILAFFTALFRILWAISQTSPGLLNTDHKLEATAAETAHWVLYGSMLMVPLTGWMHHAATEGFAPHWLPIGQGLPFIPKSEAVASFMGTLHYILVIVLGLTILAHIGGALKHRIIDRDQTLQRMLPGKNPEVEVAPHERSRLPLFAALAVWALAMGIGTFGGLFKPHNTPVEAAELAEVASDWQVSEGALGLEITQFGSPVAGGFETWTAQISFDEVADENRKHGETTVEVAIGSLSLGTVTQQAMGADFFDVATFPTATFQAEIFSEETGDNMYRADGTLTLKGVTVPLSLPFQMEVDQTTATMSGEVTLQRLDFGVGSNLPDESNLAFAVKVTVALTAERQ